MATYTPDQLGVESGFQESGTQAIVEIRGAGTGEKGDRNREAPKRTSVWVLVDKTSDEAGEGGRVIKTIDFFISAVNTYVPLQGDNIVILGTTYKITTVGRIQPGNELYMYEIKAVA